MIKNVIFIYFNDLECIDEYIQLNKFLKQEKSISSICYVLAAKISIEVSKYLKQQKDIVCILLNKKFERKQYLLLLVEKHRDSVFCLLNKKELFFSIYYDIVFSDNLNEYIYVPLYYKAVSNNDNSLDRFYLGKNNCLIRKDIDSELIIDAYFWTGLVVFRTCFIEKVLLLVDFASLELNKNIEKFNLVKATLISGDFLEKEYVYTQKKPALFLDRDGIINVDTGYPHKVDELRIIEDIFPTLFWAQSLGFYLIVVSNQSGLARGVFSQKDFFNFLQAINCKLNKKDIYIDHWYYCPYHKDAIVDRYKGCSLLRKSYPGMVLKALADYPIDLKHSIMLGDSKTDILSNIKLKTILVGSKVSSIRPKDGLTIVENHKQIKNACNFF